MLPRNRRTRKRHEEKVKRQDDWPKVRSGRKKGDFRGVTRRKRVWEQLDARNSREKVRTYLREDLLNHGLKRNGKNTASPPSMEKNTHG